jgi:uncharacterized membrane protein (UPF0127 family)
MNFAFRGFARSFALMALFLLVPVATVSCSPGEGRVYATVNGSRLSLEVASTESARAQGLMYRKELARNAGMVFIFPETAQHSFWMKNTPLPLDMIFLDEEKKVVGIIESAVPYSTKSVGVSAPSKYVIEVNAGVADELGIAVGMKVEF